MNKKWILIVIVLVALSLLAVAYMGYKPGETNSACEMKSFNVSLGSYELSEFINNVKTQPNYEGYDVETVKWMESLGNKRVFTGNDSIVIMDGADASKLPRAPDITDVYIYNHFTAEVVESHDLGNNQPTVYRVQNVNFTNQEIVDGGLA